MSREEHLSLEETRLLNIARNNDFLRNLFGPSELTIPPPAAKAVESGCESPSAIKERRAKLAIENIRAKASLKKEFMHRETEIEELFGYIDENLRNAPALLIHGNSGCGKTTVTSAVLQQLKVPCTVVQCAGFTSTREFIAVMWDKLRDNMKQLRGEFERQYKAAIQLHMNDIRHPAKFADFTVALGRLIYNLFDAWGLPKSTPHQCYYVVFDGAEHLHALDYSLVENLANLSKLSSDRVKVIITTERSLRLSHPHLAVSFAPYNEKHLVSILNKLVQQRLRQHREQADDEEWLHSVLGHTATDSDDTEDEACDEIRAGLLTPLMDRIGDALSANYNGVLSIALPGFLTTCSHPCVLMEASLSCWSALYGSTPEDVLSSAVTSYLEESAETYANTASTKKFQSPVRRSRTNSAQSTPNVVNKATNKYPLDSTVLDKVLGHYLPGATAVQVRAAVKLVQHLPTYSFSAGEVVKLARKSGVELKRPALSSSTIVMPGVVKQASELDKIDTTWMRMRAWVQCCPTRVRYLLLAAFLCGVNPKESDNLKFGGAQEGRRKKQRLGTDHDADRAGGRAGKAGATSASALTSQYFSLERLISLYAQLAGIITHKLATGYGELSIYASVKMLVEKGLLSEIPHWEIQRPFYLSCIARDAADEVAASVGFNLADFMYHSQHNSVI